MQDTDTFRAETRAWLQAHCPPAMRQPLTQEEIVWSGSEITFGNDDQRVWFERMRDRGWFAPDWPKELGGGGLTPKQARIVEQEMQRLSCRPPQFNLGVWMLGPVLLEIGTEEQKREHLPPMMQGRMRWCQGFSEPNAGSDLASLKTSARVDENGDFVINGSKIWTSYGDAAGTYQRQHRRGGARCEHARPGGPDPHGRPERLSGQARPQRGGDHAGGTSRAASCLAAQGWSHDVRAGWGLRRG